MIKRAGHLIIDVPQCIGERARIYCTTEPNRIVPTEKIAELRQRKAVKRVKNEYAQVVAKTSVKISKSLVSIL